MKAEVLDQWIADLRSGDYKQATGSPHVNELEDDDGDCLLDAEGNPQAYLALLRAAMLDEVAIASEEFWALKVPTCELRR